MFYLASKWIVPFILAVPAGLLIMYGGATEGGAVLAIIGVPAFIILVAIQERSHGPQRKSAYRLERERLAEVRRIKKKVRDIMGTDV